MRPSSLPVNGVLHYRVSRLSDHECHLEQAIGILEQKHRLVSPESIAPDTFTVWSGSRLKLAGLGIAWQAEFSGDNAFSIAEEAWRDLCEQAQNTGGNSSDISEGSTGFKHTEAGKLNWPLVLGSFGFTTATPSLLLVPALAVVSSGSHTWLWQARWQAGQADLRGRRENAQEAAKPTAAHTAQSSPLSPSSPAQVLRETYPHLKPEAWKAAVGCAVAEIRAGRAEKIVLARDKEIRFDRDVSLTRVTKYLADKYPTCWTYAIGDLVGASPEMLASVNEGKLLCRVLAGSAVPSQEQRLLNDPKEQLEHRLAVQSAQESLTDLNLDLQVPAPACCTWDMLPIWQPILPPRTLQNRQLLLCARQRRSIPRQQFVANPAKLLPNACPPSKLWIGAVTPPQSVGWTLMARASGRLPCGARSATLLALTLTD